MEDLLKKRNAKQKAATKGLALWTTLWVISQAIAVFGNLLLWPDTVLLKYAVLILNLLLGLQMIRANRKFLQSLDELEKQIQYESFALTLGLTLVAGLVYSTLTDTILIGVEAEISNLVMFMGITYMISLLYNRKRFS
jgi:hypothetical protein